MQVRRRRDFWYFWRYDILTREGFTADEAAIIANCQISSNAIRELRHYRLSLIQAYLNIGYTQVEAIQLVRASIIQSGQEISDWSVFRRIIYPSYAEFY